MKKILNVVTSNSMSSSLISLDELLVKAKTDNINIISLIDDNLSSFFTFLTKTNELNMRGVIGLSKRIEISGYLYDLIFYALDDEGIKQLIEINVHKRDLIFEDLGSLSHLAVIFTFSKNSFKNSSDSLFISNLSGIISKSKIFYYGVILSELLYVENVLFELEDLIARNSALESNFFPVHLIKYLDSNEIEAYSILEKISLNTNNNSYNDYNYIELSNLEKLFLGKSTKFDFNLDFLNKITYKNFYNSKLFLPDIFWIKDISVEEYLKNLCYVGLNKRLNGKISDKYLERLESELEIIHTMGFDSYFIIVYDIVLYCAKNNIPVGPGRGSAVSSLVAFSIGIIAVDPLEYDLLFERFLNTSRTELPDIDIDIADNRRKEVIDYLVLKYGEEKCYEISVFKKKDSKEIFSKICLEKKVLPSKINSIYNSISNNVVDAYDKETIYLKNIFDKIKKSTSEVANHPAGIVILNDFFVGKVPYFNKASKIRQMEYDKEIVEKIGFLKIDLLSNNFLTKINRISEEVKKVHPDFQLSKIDLQDDKTLSLINEATNSDIFQIGTSQGLELLKRFKISRFLDIVILISFERPGITANINDFIAVKENIRKARVLHPKLNDCLRGTYGIILFQEQIMQIAKIVANYTLKEADIFRRAISKKNSSLIEKEKDKFIERAFNNGFNLEEATRIFGEIEEFQGYGFNKSHAVAYSMIVYEQAFLKANYFEIYISVTLENSSNGVEINNILKEIRKRGYNIVKPSVNNLNFSYYFDDKHNFYLPLFLIKDISKEIAKEIVDEANIRKFQNLNDFKDRIQRLTEVQYKSLIHGSAFDTFSYNHRTLIKSLFENSHYSISYVGMKVVINNEEEYLFTDLRKYEYQTFGFNIFYRGIDSYSDFLKNSPNVLDVSSFIKRGLSGRVLGFIDKNKIKKIKTKTGEDMAFLTISDDSEFFEAVCFRESLISLEELIAEDALIFDIRISTYQGKISYTVEKIGRVKK
ncbi:MAG: DNA polymerase III subunit alpha [Acholeplasmatales bacterium]|jgi:DNA polymerase-3 subunit alpha|nr:DNA polymerase III subunit alpha [Acholeplasmatales bacterium]